MSAEEWPSVDWQAEIGEESGNFKDAVSADISGVFLNENEFAERRSIRYDGETYENIPVVLNGNRQMNRFLARKDPVGCILLRGQTTPLIRQDSDSFAAECAVSPERRE